jgi:hypothetical protein
VKEEEEDEEDEEEEAFVDMLLEKNQTHRSSFICTAPKNPT